LLLIVDTLNQVSYILTMQENETPTKANNTMIQTPEYTADQTKSKTDLENVLSIVANAPIEITIRGELDFTVSTEGNQPQAMKNLKRYFNKSRRLESWKTSFDSECDMTCAWFSVTA
jgi:hypothetical protein